MRPYCQPIRFPQVRFYGASWFASAAAYQVACPLCGSDRELPRHRGFYFQASVESVTLLGAGYNYDSHWMALSMGLSPIRLTSSLAARPRNLMKVVSVTALFSARGTRLATLLGAPIGIGERVASPPLPHHRTCGSAYGGSAG